MTTTAPPAAALPAPAPAARDRHRLLAPAALLAATAVLYLWGLSASGWANSFYAAAAQAGGESWTAWFFGSSDAANAITVDKPPGALWVTGLSVRLFGLSSWSILVPQALMGVAAVGLLHATVARTAGRAAGLLAGAALALTPVAVLMFRFNNPDALLVLLLVAAAWATLRAVERGGTRWLLLAAVLVGCGFLTKMLQAFLVLPAFALVWLVAAPVGIGRRLRDLVLAGVAVVVSAGWWVAVVELWPAESRPYVGGSQTDSVLELVLGYNGLGRLTGNETGSVGAGAAGWGGTGPLRLFDAELGGQAAWLLPAALVLMVALLWTRRRAPRTDPLRAAALLWGGWLLVTGTVFSLMEGIFHGYYLVALAPAVAALVGIGAAHLWRARAGAGARALLAGTLLLTAAWAFVLLRRTPDWLPWLAWAVLVAGAVAAAALLVVHLAPRAVVAAALALAAVAGLAGPAAYSLATAATPHSGPLPTAGPQGAGWPGGRGGPGGWPGDEGAPPGAPAGAPPVGSFPGGAFPDGTFPDGTAPGGGPGGAGGLFGGSTPSAEVVALLEQDAGAHTWVAATVGSSGASGYQLATEEPVMAIGGFNGTDPAPTLAEFQELVAAGRVRWFVAGTGPGGTASGGSDAAQQIAQWVAAEFPATTVDGIVLHDLTG